MDIFLSLITGAWEKSVHEKAKKEGREEGAQGRPTPDTPAYSVGETAVRNEIEKKLGTIRSKLSNEVQKKLPEISRHIAGVHEAEVKFESRLEPDSTRRNIESAFESHRATLNDAYFRKHQSEGNYNSFRHLHDVRIDPDHVLDKTHYLSAVLVILVLETVINALFWKEGLEGDLIQGLLMALGIAAANIIVGFVGGICLSYKNLKDTLKNVLGITGFVACLALVVYINLRVLHIRAEQLGTTSVNQLTNTLVFLLGFGFALFAAFKGYRFFGTYPGYRAAAETYIKATADIKAEEELLRTLIAKEVRSQEDLRNTSIRNLSDALTKYAKIRGELQTMDSAYSTSVKHLNNVLESAVGTYRKTNIAVKGTSVQSPLWFSDPVERYGTESEVLGDAQSNLANATGDAESKLEMMRRLSKVEISALNELKAEFTGPTLTALKSDADLAGLSRFTDTLKDTIGNQGKRAGA
jgi:hypothetical protein